MTGQNRSPQHFKAEWVTFLVSTAIVSLLVGLVLHSWLTKSDQPPIISVTASDNIQEIDGSFYVSFTVINTGGETAESVEVIGELQTGGKIEESGQQQIDFLASGEKEKGAFIFRKNPRQGVLILRVASYKLP
ncbi:MAG: hypothetical protein N5P05_001112 [Chroococcopsis gigantea SAG 12.99]|jgi:uncharacterized protein (TIGR02588 family)|nr:TIGR02588 family protein [Chlorogloea purpurea SAG 13.99]MDV2999506.1 hypothetical protein [Chroococcopsis gigantea SAG 12.99]